MIPWAARKARRSRRGATTRNSRLPSIRSDSQIFERGPAHGSRRSINQGTALPIVASPATRWAVCGGPLLTTTSGWSRRIRERVRSAARSSQPRLSSGKVKKAATSRPSWRSGPGGADGFPTCDAVGNASSDGPRARRRSRRQPSLNVQKRGNDSTSGPLGAVFPIGGTPVTTEIFQPRRARYFVIPNQRRPPTGPSGPK